MTVEDAGQGYDRGLSVAPSQMGQAIVSHTHPDKHTLREVRVRLEKLRSPAIHQFYERLESKQRDGDG